MVMMLLVMLMMMLVVMMFLVMVMVIMDILIMMTVVMMVVMSVMGQMAVHVDSAMEIAVRLLDHRPSQHGARVTERNGKDAFAANNLRERVFAFHLLLRGNAEQRKDQGGRHRDREKPHAADAGLQVIAGLHSRFLLSANEARARSAMIYAQA